MLRRMTVMAVLAMVGGAVDAGAQVTGQPSFNAPYRAFRQFEFGAALSFPNYDQGPAVEGMYRFASSQFDIGFRGGIFFSDFGSDAFLAGVEARYRAITHTVSFPLDGAIIFGGGLASEPGSQFFFPFGLSLGRRLDVSDSEVSIVPYAQPTLILWNRDLGLTRKTDVEFVFGLGGDFRLSRAFDVRLGIGLGDVFDGISISAVWLR